MIMHSFHEDISNRVIYAYDWQTPLIDLTGTVQLPHHNFEGDRGKWLLNNKSQTEASVIMTANSLHKFWFHIASSEF